MKHNFILSALAVSVLTVSMYAQAATRDLVFEDDEEEAVAEETISIKTTVQLDRAGEKSTVSPNATFKSGDKVKIEFTPSIDGYAYWMAKGSSGEYTVLFPNEKAGMDNAVKRNEVFTIPVKGSFKFDDTPGEENLLCIVSPNRIPELDSAIAANNPTAMVDSLEEESTSSTRDLVFEDDEDTDVNTATQSTANGEPFVQAYVLKHE